MKKIKRVIFLTLARIHLRLAAEHLLVCQDRCSSGWSYQRIRHIHQRSHGKQAEETGIYKDPAKQRKC